MSKKPAVSIIMPAYNSQEFIERAISSVSGQSFSGWELIIIDDASSDSSLDIIDKWTVSDERVHLIRLKDNSGAAVARNVGIEAANGRYIAFLDSDDSWFPNKLEQQLKFMDQRNSEFSCGSYHIVRPDGTHVGSAYVPLEADYYSVLRSPRIGCLTAMYDTQRIGKIYMPLIRKRQDFGLWLRILKKTGVVHGIQEPLASYLVRDDSISANKVDAARYTWRIYRDFEQLGLVRSLYYFSHYAVRNGLRSKAPGLASRLGF